MTDMQSFFHLLSAEEIKKEQTLPKEFNYPFYYKPHPLADLASRKIQHHIENLNLDHNFGFDKNTDEKIIGKMFGILIAQNEKGEIGYLAAFSGKLAGKNHHKGFVPPVFDMLSPTGFFKTEEKVINHINLKIEKLEESTTLKELKKLVLIHENEIFFFKKSCNQFFGLIKLERKALKSNHTDKLSEEALKTKLKELELKSIHQNKVFKKELKKRETQLDELKEKLKSLENEIIELKKERKEKSNKLQHELFDNYSFLNARGEKKSLWRIFMEEKDMTPPAGAGECALPKLLHFAYQNNFKPICFAEFWWGNSPEGKIRKHMNYYPSCKAKCEPILGHMLVGLNVEKNPLNIKLEKEIELKALYEDEYLVVIDKPNEFLSAPGKVITDSVLTRMQKKYPDATGPLLVHRLDMSTSGIILVAKTKEVHKGLQQQFENRTVKKRYIAVLDGTIENDQGTIELPLRTDFENRPQQMVCDKYGKPSTTFYKKIKETDTKTWIHFFPHTGRTHQLRVHSAHKNGLGIPIVGDDLYGKSSNRLHLHAESLEFIHPMSGKKIKMISKPPF